MRRLILASGSPRRRLLLAAAGYDFDVIPADVDERMLDAEAAGDMVLRLSTEKARVVADRVDPAACVLAVDTTVVIDEHILGKPADDAEAATMLRRLAGNTHEVLSGFAAIVRGEERMITGVSVTEVTMRPLSDSEIAEYVATGEPHDKAGSYAFQGYGRRLVSGVAGLKSNIVGLPLEPIVEALRALGVERRAPAPRRAQSG